MTYGMTKAQLAQEVDRLRRQNGILAEENRQLRARLARRKPASRQLSLTARPHGALRSLPNVEQR